jgi:hypothetical protein
LILVSWSKSSNKWILADTVAWHGKIAGKKILKEKDFLSKKLNVS